MKYCLFSEGLEELVMVLIGDLYIKVLIIIRWTAIFYYRSCTVMISRKKQVLHEENLKTKDLVKYLIKGVNLRIN